VAPDERHPALLESAVQRNTKKLSKRVYLALAFGKDTLDNGEAIDLLIDQMVEWGWSYGDLMRLDAFELKERYKIAEARRAARQERERQATVKRRR
jgi:hypothetical protein